MGETRFIVAGKFIDGSGADVRKNVFLAVQDGIITDIDSTAHLPGKDEAVIDDLSHCIILPPFVDGSIYLSRSPSVDSSVRLSLEESTLAQKAVMLKWHSGYCHAHGVLGVAENDDIADLLGNNRKGMIQKSLIDIRTPGDFLKIGYSTNIEDEDFQNSPRGYDDLCRTLLRRGDKKAVVVANGQQKVEEALAAGCDAIEQGYSMGEDNLREMAKKDVLWIPSVLRAKNGLDGASGGGDVCCRFSQRYVAPGKPIPGAEAFWKKVVAEQLTQLQIARELGVKTAVGTGAGSVGILHGESVIEEIKLFMKAGYSLEEAIGCASESGSRFFGMETLGAVAIGKKATFLVTRGTVKQLPRKLSFLEGIYVNGERMLHK